MALEALSTSELLDFIISDTLCATPFSCNNESSSEIKFLLDNNEHLRPHHQEHLNGAILGSTSSCSMPTTRGNPLEQTESSLKKQHLAVQVGRKKRRRRPKACKNKEEAETQRMTHIAVERNRRKQMNEHLAELRSLMPESYVQRGDQASIVGGAIEYVKELEHMLQTLEAQKFLLKQGRAASNDGNTSSSTNTTARAMENPFGDFFAYPQYTCCQFPNSKHTSSKSKAAIAEIEVTLIESHANVRILSRRRVRQLSTIIAAFHTLYLTILHLNVTTLDPLVLYTLTAKAEEGCQLNSADDIASAVHHILRIIEEEAANPSSSSPP